MINCFQMTRGQMDALAHLNQVCEDGLRPVGIRAGTIARDDIVRIVHEGGENTAEVRVWLLREFFYVANTNLAALNELLPEDRDSDYTRHWLALRDFARCGRAFVEGGREGAAPEWPTSVDLDAALPHRNRLPLEPFLVSAAGVAALMSLFGGEGGGIADGAYKHHGINMQTVGALQGALIRLSAGDGEGRAFLTVKDERELVLNPVPNEHRPWDQGADLCLKLFEATSPHFGGARIVPFYGTVAILHCYAAGGRRRISLIVGEKGTTCIRLPDEQGTFFEA